MTQWTPFSEKEQLFRSLAKEFMINYRVDNLEALLEELKKKKRDHPRAD